MFQPIVNTTKVPSLAPVEPTDSQATVAADAGHETYLY